MSGAYLNIEEAISTRIISQIFNDIRLKYSSDRELGHSHFRKAIIDHANNLMNKKSVIDATIRHIYGTYKQISNMPLKINEIYRLYLFRYMSSQELKEKSDSDMRNIFSELLSRSIIIFCEKLEKKDPNMYIRVNIDQDTVNYFVTTFSEIMSDKMTNIYYRSIAPDTRTVPANRYDKLAADYKALKLQYNKLHNQYLLVKEKKNKYEELLEELRDAQSEDSDTSSVYRR